MGVLSIFFKMYTQKSNWDCSEFLIIKFLFFKIKIKKISENGNQVFINNKKQSIKKLKNKNFKLYISGSNNIVELPDESKVTNLSIYINGSNNRVIIKEPDYMFNQLTVAIIGNFNNRTVFIDNNCLISGVFNIFCIQDNKKVVIGKNCMLAAHSGINTTDGHRIYDLETNEIINKEEDVIIGDNVWITENCSIGKGSVIPQGCIVATKSFVNKKFDEPNCILAGLPAKIVKRNIRWEK